MTESVADPQTKVCPQCAEEVKAAALICRFCRYDFAPTAGKADPVQSTAAATNLTRAPVSSTAPAAIPAKQASKAPWLIVVGIIAVVVAGVFLVNNGSAGKTLPAEVKSWCSANVAAVVAQGRRLGVPVPGALRIKVGNTTTPAAAWGANLPESVWAVIMLDQGTMEQLAVLWRSSNQEGYNKACQAAWDQH
jgi:rubredoxin